MKNVKVILTGVALCATLFAANQRINALGGDSGFWPNDKDNINYFPATINDNGFVEVNGLGTSGEDLILDFHELVGSGDAHAQDDYFAFVDTSDSNGSRKASFSLLEDSVFGNVSGDATIANGGALTIGANAVQTGMVHDDVATELAGTGMTATSGVLNVIGGTAITANANDIAVTAGSIGDTQLAYNTGQALTTSSNVEFANLTADATTFAGDMSVTADTATFTSANSNDPIVIIKNTNLVLNINP